MPVQQHLALNTMRRPSGRPTAMTKYLKTFAYISFTLLMGCIENTNSPITEPDNPFGSNPIECESHIENSINWPAILHASCHKLSQYGLFNQLEDNRYQVNTPAFPYELNSHLFTDHARKYRFILLPNDTTITYTQTNAFEFPIGSTLIKVFSLPISTSKKDEALIEIRLLIYKKSGWQPLVFKWYPELNDAYLTIAGETITSSLEHEGLAMNVSYKIPSLGQCTTCHLGENNQGQPIISPIGLKARHLNKILSTNINQLTHWKDNHVIQALPDDLSTIDTAPNWQDANANLQDRAKAYLDINCAHCHSDTGSAALSGLRLEFWRKEINYLHGVCNASHGWRGGGFDIWPGRGEISSIPVRMRHIEPKDRMPPIGRSIVDEKAAQLISDWIDSLPYQTCNSEQSPL